jgi:hypothetical protein
MITFVSSARDTPRGCARTGGQAIADKMPLNSVLVGLIHLALLNARFINLRRDPLHTCVSCFSLLFSGSPRLAYDLAELGHHYRDSDG